MPNAVKKADQSEEFVSKIYDETAIYMSGKPVKNAQEILREMHGSIERNLKLTKDHRRLCTLRISEAVARQTTLAKAAAVALAALQVSASPMPVTDQQYKSALSQADSEIEGTEEKFQSFKTRVPGSDTAAKIYAVIGHQCWSFTGPINLPHCEVQAHIYRHTVHF